MYRSTGDTFLRRDFFIMTLVPCKGALKKHIEADHKKEFTCSKCDFSTPSKGELKVHQGFVRGRFEYVPLSAIIYMLIFFKVMLSIIERFFYNNRR